MIEPDAGRSVSLVVWFGIYGLHNCPFFYAMPLDTQGWRKKMDHAFGVTRTSHARRVVAPRPFLLSDPNKIFF